jgi:hypothetical protein
MQQIQNPRREGDTHPTELHQHGFFCFRLTIAQICSALRRQRTSGIPYEKIQGNAHFGSVA